MTKQDKKPRELWLEETSSRQDGNRSAYPFKPGNGIKTIAFIERTAYDSALALMDEMAEALEHAHNLIPNHLVVSGYIRKNKIAAVIHKYHAFKKEKVNEK